MNVYYPNAPMHRESTNQTKKAGISKSLSDKMDTQSEVKLVPVTFLKTIDDKVAKVKETLLWKQAVLSQVQRTCLVKGWR